MSCSVVLISDLDQEICKIISSQISLPRKSEQEMEMLPFRILHCTCCSMVRHCFMERVVLRRYWVWEMEKKIPQFLCLQCESYGSSIYRQTDSAHCLVQDISGYLRSSFTKSIIRNWIKLISLRGSVTKVMKSSNQSLVLILLQTFLF